MCFPQCNWDPRINPRLVTDTNLWHFRPYWMSCSHCLVEYDAMLRQETLAEDLAFVSRLLTREDTKQVTVRPGTILGYTAHSCQLCPPLKAFFQDLGIHANVGRAHMSSEEKNRIFFSNLTKQMVDGLYEFYEKVYVVPD